MKNQKHTSGIYSRIFKKQVSQRDEIVERMKKTLLTDEVIDWCISLHEHNPDMFVNMVDKFEELMWWFLDPSLDDPCRSVYEAFLTIRDERLMRFGLVENVEVVEVPKSNYDIYDNVDRIIISMVAQLSKYSHEINVAELLSRLKVLGIQD